jgi:hypothetical protein
MGGNAGAWNRAACIVTLAVCAALIQSGAVGATSGAPPWLALADEASGVYYPASGLTVDWQSGEPPPTISGSSGISIAGSISNPLGTTLVTTERGAIVSSLSGSPPVIVTVDPDDLRAGGHGNFGRRDFDAAVPEPAAAALFAAGFALVASRLAGTRCRRRP